MNFSREFAGQLIVSQRPSTERCAKAGWLRNKLAAMPLPKLPALASRVKRVCISR
jgi:hypothetical protein